MTPSTSPPADPGPDDAVPGVLLRLVGEAQDRPADAEMLALLDAVERRRAARTADAGLRSSFITGRYLLRLLAAEVLGVAADTLTSSFRCPRCGRSDGVSDHGRPGYAVEGMTLPLALSLSRSRGFILLGAVDLAAAPPRSAGAPSGSPGLGLDLESVERVGFDGFDEVALSPAERLSVARLPRQDRAVARCRLWTRKEALVKALGTGFADRDPAAVDGSDSRIGDLHSVDGVRLASEGLVGAIAVVRPAP